MRRALFAALVAALLVPGALRAQEAALPELEPDSEPAPETRVYGPAETEPGSSEGAGALAADAPDPYVVQPGDTLWDLSAKYLGDPWVWPKVWSYNPEIENPHWIYPGNTIRFRAPGGAEAPAGEGPPQEDEAFAEQAEEPLPGDPAQLPDVSSGTLAGPTLTDREGQDPVSMAETGPVPAETLSRPVLARQDALVTKRELDASGVIVRAWADRDLLSTFDQVYVRFRDPSSVRPGDVFSIFRAGREVRHPVTGRKHGYLTRVVGTLKVLSIESDLATAQIEQCLDPIERGDRVAPLGNFNRQLAARPNSRNLEGVILASLVPETPALGEQHLVFVDKGARDGVEPGNTFQVMQEGDPVYGKVRDMPDAEVATILVIDVKESASTGVVTRSAREVVLGDKAVMRAAQ